jgi:predicted nuclease with TOPRIM domain
MGATRSGTGNLSLSSFIREKVEEALEQLGEQPVEQPGKQSGEGKETEEVEPELSRLKQEISRLEQENYRLRVEERNTPFSPRRKREGIIHWPHEKSFFWSEWRDTFFEKWPDLYRRFFTFLADLGGIQVL